VLPAIFEKSNPGYSSRILPAVEGCVYPLYFVNTGFAGCTLEQVYASQPEQRYVCRSQGAHAQSATRY